MKDYCIKSIISIRENITELMFEPEGYNIGEINYTEVKAKGKLRRDAIYDIDYVVVCKDTWNLLSKYFTFGNLFMIYFGDFLILLFVIKIPID